MNKFLKYIYKRVYNFLFYKNKNSVKIGNYTAHIPDDELWCFTGGEYYEKNVIYWLSKIISSKDKPVLYEIGANYGYYVLKFAKECSSIIALEPIQKSYNILCQNVVKNRVKNVLLIKKGISDYVGKAEMFTYSSNLNNSLFKRNLPKGHSLKEVGKEEVLIDTLDNLVETEGLVMPDIILIDVEGAELNALKGSVALLKQCKPILIFEYSETTSNDANYLKEDILLFLRGFNYKFFGLSEDPNITTLINEEFFDSDSIANIIAIPEGSNISL